MKGWGELGKILPIIAVKIFGNNIGNVVLNPSPEKVIELYEKRLEDKDVIIAAKDEIIESLKKQLGKV